MEQIARERIYTELENPTPRLRLSMLLLILVCMLGGFAVIMLGVRTVAQYGTPPANPFPAYADIFPGQPATDLEARAFSCWNGYNYYEGHPENYDPTEESCIFTPPSGVFSSIEIRRMQGVIRQTTFTLRDDTLQVGDLENFLHLPRLHTLYRTGYFFLPGDFVIVETRGHSGPFSLFLSVWSVSFTDMSLLT